MVIIFRPTIFCGKNSPGDFLGEKLSTGRGISREHFSWNGGSIYDL